MKPGFLGAHHGKITAAGPRLCLASCCRSLEKSFHGITKALKSIYVEETGGFQSSSQFGTHTQHSKKKQKTVIKHYITLFKKTASHLASHSISKGWGLLRTAQASALNLSLMSQLAGIDRRGFPSKIKYLDN